MSHTTTYNTSWDGKTGAEVAGIIQGALVEHATALNNAEAALDKSVKSLNFSVNEQTSTVTCTAKLNDNTDQISTFTLKPVSTSTGTLEITNYSALAQGNSILQHGESFSFNYTYEIRNANNAKLKNLQGAITVRVTDAKGNSIDYEKGNTVLTTTGTNNEGTITLNANELPEGTNIIKVFVQATVSGSTVNLTTEPEFKLNVLNPVLIVSFDEGDGVGKMRGFEDKFNMFFSVKSSTGGALTINGQPVSVTKRLYYNINPAYATTDSSINVSYSDICGSRAHQIGRQRLFVQGEIKVGEKTVYSNIVLLYMMCNNNASATYTWYAMQLNDVAQITSGDPTVTVNQYDTTKFDIYAYANQAVDLTYRLIQNAESSVLTTKSITANSVADVSYSYIFKSDSAGQTFRIIDSNNNQMSIALNVKSIGSSLGELTSQVVSLSSAGKSQTDHTWGSYVEFDSNFDWSGNGWIDGALLINNGATAVIKYAPFSTGVFAASFKICANNSIANEKLVYCGNDNTGFAIYPEKAVFTINGNGISTEFDSDAAHEITFVRYGASYGNLIAIYIDGQGQQSKAVSDDASTMSSYVTMTANLSQVSVYNVNIFSQALSFTNVQALYCFNQTNSTDIINYIKANNVFPAGTLTTSIGDHGQDITPDSLPVGSRYMIISTYINATDGTSLDDYFWKTMDEYPGSEAEKYKGIGHLTGNVKFVEKLADGAISARNFCVDKSTLCPQGTSSMAYPIKNFRLRFQKPIDATCKYYNETPNTAYWGSDAAAGDFGYSTVIYTGVSPDFKIKTKGITPATYSYEVDSKYTYKKKTEKKAKYPLYSTSWGDSYTGADAKIFCLKADYAESAGAHNTGYARMVHEAFTNSANICPEVETNSILPQQYVVNNMGSEAVYKKQIRSVIDGFPIYLFFEAADGTIIFHGKYNFNNEKSSKDVFGFEKIHDYFNNSVVKDESNLLKRLFNDTVGYYDATHFKYGIKSGEFINDEADGPLNFINPTECWEFSNNTFDVAPTAQNVIGAFQYPYTVSFDGNSNLTSMPKYSTYPNKNPFTVKDSDGNLAWLSEAWEYRYPGLDDGSAGDLYYKNGNCPPYLLDSLYKWLYKHNGNLTNFDESNLNDFAENLHKYFNINYLLKYFVLTKWGGNVDQRIKNCMLSFYCDPTVESNEDTESPMGHMRGFFIFYDNDTILGVDNAGTLTQNWDIDEDVYPGYGKHAIWDNLEYCYKYYVQGKTEYSGIRNLGAWIEAAYQAIRKVITDDKLTQYFETDQVDRFPDAIHNLDADVKYYFIGKYNSTVTNFNSSSISKFQGNRRFHRRRWLKKRTNWFDSKFKAGNYSKYSYKFKVGGTSGQSQEGGNIVLTSAIKDWRFHIFNTTGQNLASSGLLNVGDSATLNIKANSFSISDFVSIAALYGCSSINLNDFVVSTWFQDLDSGGETLPYLKKFVLNEPTNTTKKKVFSSAAFNKLLTINNSDGTTVPIFPNLEELVICNTNILSGNGEASTRFGVLNLSEFSKLEKLDTTGTDVDVILPNSSQLVSCILQSPQTLSISNKSKLTSLTIRNSSNLNTINLGPGNSSYVYNNILPLIITKADTTGFTSNIVLGTKDDYYSISDAQIDYLLNLADLDLDNISVSGYIYNADISNEDLDTLTTKFPDLVVSASVSSTLEFSLSTSSLREGESLTINLTSGLLDSPSDWYWAIYNESTSTWVENNSLNNLITEDSDNKTRTKLVLKAALSNTNNSATYRLKVGANYGNQLVEYAGEIPIQYIAVTDISLASEKTILGANESTQLSFSCSPVTHTKTEWVKSQARWTVSNCSINSTSLLLTMNSSQSDATAYLTAGTITSDKITIIFDAQLSTYTDTSAESNNNSLHWIYQLLFNTYGLDGVKLKTPIKVSTLNDITLTNSDISSLAYSFDNGSSSVIVPQDLTYLQYCKFSGTQFTIPGSLQFTNIVIPYNKYLTEVNWNLNIDSYVGYQNVVFPASLETANISITGESAKLNSLILDFSKTKITKIYNGNGSCDNMAASVSFTYNTSAANGNPPSYDDNGAIFKYPSTLTTFGNYVEKDSWTSVYSAIFNLNGVSSDSTKAYAPLYVIPACSTVTKLGPLYNYTVSNNYSGFPWTASNFTHLYQAFKNNSNLPNGSIDAQTFSNTVQIGNNTFNGANITNLTINGNITDIGNSAFMSFTGNLKSSIPNTAVNAQSFTVLKTIGDYAFANLSTSHVFEFKSLTKVGNQAFAVADGADYHHTIYIEQTTPFEYSEYSFGSGNTIYMPNALKTELAKSSELWTKLNSHVTIQTLNV